MSAALDRATPRRDRLPVNWDDVIVEAAATDTGMRRTNNQDSYAVVRAQTEAVWKDRGHVFIVADGMGAHAVGELASKMACDFIPHNYKKTKNLGFQDAIVKSYQEVGAQINAKAANNRDFQGMGTTCTTLVLHPAGALIAHVGDSRCYRIRENRIEQLSFDHSLVWELVKRHGMKMEQAMKSVPRNVITRSLGPDPTVEVDVEGPMKIEQGDIYVLCSDGLSGPVHDIEIGAFAKNFHPEDACRYLLHLANLRGGQDNITVLVVRIGPWVDPNAAGANAGDAPAAKTRDGNGRGFLGGLFARKPAEEPVKERIYVKKPAEISEKLVDRLAETVRLARGVALEQKWEVEWPVLANLVNESGSARGEGDLRNALRCLGESISMLGLAGRIHRKQRQQHHAG